MSTAESYVGVTEGPGEEIGDAEKLFAAGRNEAWCADFVVTCYDAAGVSLPGLRYMLPSVKYMEQQIMAAGYYVYAADVAKKRRSIFPGDLIFFQWRVGSDKKAGGRHVGIVVKTEGEYVITVEGNVSDMVKRRRWALTSHAIAGYGRILPQEA